MIGALLVLGTTSAGAETLVERGAYIANTVMTCNSCHTPRGPNGFDMTQQFSGGQQMFEEPAFKVAGANITPDRDTGIGAWTDAELRRFLVTGIKPDGIAAASVMPTAFYPVLTARDLDALVAFLRSLPAIRRELPSPEYRISVAREEPPYADRQMTEAEMANPLARGRYLVTIAHCLECHTPDGPNGPDFTQAGKGGHVFKGPWGQVVSANITPDPTKGLGQWSDDEIRRAITEGISRDGHRLKPPMGFASYARMTRQDQDAIIAFLRTLPPR